MCSSFSQSSSIRKGFTAHLSATCDLLGCTRGLTFVKNNFGGTIPEMRLGEDESELLALVSRELKLYIDNLEKIK